MTDHQRVMAAIESSRVFSFCDRIVAWVWRTSSQSRAAGELVTVIDWRRRLTPDVVRLALGTMLVTASAVHVLLMLAFGARESWLWPLIPAIAAAAGATLLLFSRTRA